MWWRVYVCLSLLCLVSVRALCIALLSMACMHSGTGTGIFLPYSLYLCFLLAPAAATAAIQRPEKASW